MNFIQIVKLVISLLPTVIEAIKAIEAAVPQGGSGADKLGTLKTILQAAYDTSNETAGQFEKIWPVLQSTATGLVGLFNKAGVFAKGDSGTASS